jgi:hypothetical protein
MSIGNNDCIALKSTIMEGQQSFTLRWHSFSCWGRGYFTFSFAYKRNQYFVYGYMQRITQKITQHTWQRTVHAPLNLIFMMEQGGCYDLFCVYRQWSVRWWLCATYLSADYPRYMTKNSRHAVDAHFHHGAVSVLLYLLPIKAANTSFMTICNLSLRRSPEIHDPQSLTLRWHSFCHGWIHIIHSLDLV